MRGRRPDLAFAPDLLARDAVLEYEQWRLTRGHAEPSLWRAKVAHAGVDLPPPPQYEQGDAYEGLEPWTPPAA